MGLAHCLRLAVWPTAPGIHLSSCPQTRAASYTAKPGFFTYMLAIRPRSLCLHGRPLIGSGISPTRCLYFYIQSEPQLTWTLLLHFCFLGEIFGIQLPCPLIAPPGPDQIPPGTPAHPPQCILLGILKVKPSASPQFASWPNEVIKYA